eukprot:862576-Pelagomonas_calceolata.AAC.2
MEGVVRHRSQFLAARRRHGVRVRDSSSSAWAAATSCVGGRGGLRRHWWQRPQGLQGRYRQQQQRPQSQQQVQQTWAGQQHKQGEEPLLQQPLLQQQQQLQQPPPLPQRVQQASSEHHAGLESSGQGGVVELHECALPGPCGRSCSNARSSSGRGGVVELHERALPEPCGRSYSNARSSSGQGAAVEGAGPVLVQDACPLVERASEQAEQGAASSHLDANSPGGRGGWEGDEGHGASSSGGHGGREGDEGSEASSTAGCGGWDGDEVYGKSGAAAAMQDDRSGSRNLHGDEATVGSASARRTGGGGPPQDPTGMESIKKRGRDDGNTDEEGVLMCPAHSGRAAAAAATLPPRPLSLTASSCPSLRRVTPEPGPGAGSTCPLLTDPSAACRPGAASPPSVVQHSTAAPQQLPPAALTAGDGSSSLSPLPFSLGTHSSCRPLLASKQNKQLQMRLQMRKQRVRTSQVRLGNRHHCLTDGGSLILNFEQIPRKNKIECGNVANAQIWKRTAQTYVLEMVFIAVMLAGQKARVRFSYSRRGISASGG